LKNRQGLKSVGPELSRSNFGGGERWLHGCNPILIGKWLPKTTFRPGEKHPFPFFIGFLAKHPAKIEFSWIFFDDLSEVFQPGMQTAPIPDGMVILT
jgi:hypothetical protein